MTRDDILQMAREANLPACHASHPVALARFAALVAAAERKAIEPIVFGLCISDNNAQEIVNAIRERSNT